MVERVPDKNEVPGPIPGSPTMKLEAYLEHFAERPDYLPLTEINSVLKFESDTDAYEAEKQLKNMQDQGYPGVNFQRSNRVFHIHLASIASEAHLDYLDRLMTSLRILEPTVIPTFR